MNKKHICTISKNKWGKSNSIFCLFICSLLLIAQPLKDARNIRVIESFVCQNHFFLQLRVRGPDSEAGGHARPGHLHLHRDKRARTRRDRCSTQGRAVIMYSKDLNQPLSSKNIRMCNLYMCSYIYVDFFLNLYLLLIGLNPFPLRPS